MFDTLSQPLFVCPRHSGGLRLSVLDCAHLYRRGKKARAWESVRLCYGCPIGAAHAGEVVPPAIPAAGLCVRCGDTGKRLVRGQMCVSCYNREREAVTGRNRRGNPPQAPLKIVVLSLWAGKWPLAVPVAHRLELALLSSRRQPGATVARCTPLEPGPLAGLIPGLPSCLPCPTRAPRPLYARSHYLPLPGIPYDLGNY